jgi:hypothetical protein
MSPSLYMATSADASKIEFRVAVNKDCPRLADIVRAAVEPDDGSFLGYLLQRNPAKYQRDLPSLVRLFTTNTLFTGIVAETTDEAGVKRVVGYAAWGWVGYPQEHGSDGNGAPTTSMLMSRSLPAKYLPSERRRHSACARQALIS